MQPGLWSNASLGSNLRSTKDMLDDLREITSLL